MQLPNNGERRAGQSALSTHERAIAMWVMNGKRREETRTSKTVRHTCKMTHIWIRKYFSVLHFAFSLSRCPRMLRSFEISLEKMCVIRIQLHSPKLRKSSAVFIFLVKRKFRLIDDSKAQFENDVAENSHESRCLRCKCARRRVPEDEKQFFVCSGFKDLSVVSSYCCGSTCSEIKNSASHFSCTRELPHRRMYFQLRLHNARAELRHFVLEGGCGNLNIST